MFTSARYHQGLLTHFDVLMKYLRRAKTMTRSLDRLCSPAASYVGNDKKMEQSGADTGSLTRIAEYHDAQFWSRRLDIFKSS